VALRAKEGQLEELSRAGQQALKSQPFSALIGARLTSLSEGKAVLEVPIREEVLQQDGYVLGGVISYIADNALTFAGGSVLGPAVLTSKYKINYLRPASGETLLARASVVNAGRPCAAAKFSPLARVGKKRSARLRRALSSPYRLRGRRNECRAATGLRARRRTTARTGVRRPRTQQLPRSRALRALPTLRQEHRPLQLATGPKGGARRLRVKEAGKTNLTMTSLSHGRSQGGGDCS
jgi:uncharacterized protein (TIGR00369 family)